MKTYKIAYNKTRPAKLLEQEGIILKMKKIIYELVLLTFVIWISVSNINCSSVHFITGNGKLMTSEKKVSIFEKIKSGGVAEVRFYASEQYHVTVTVDTNLCEFVEIFTQNNVLNIRAQRGCNYDFTKFLVEVYSPILTGVSISGSGSFVGTEKIITQSFEASVSGSGIIEGAIECENFYGKISGSGQINVVGATKDTNIIIAGSGNFNGNSFNAKNATVSVSGSGIANICVDDNLNAHVSGSGSINYCGKPAQINSTVSGLGRVKEM